MYDGEEDRQAAKACVAKGQEAQNETSEESPERESRPPKAIGLFPKTPIYHKKRMPYYKGKSVDSAGLNL